VSDAYASGGVTLEQAVSPGVTDPRCAVAWRRAAKFIESGQVPP